MYLDVHVRENADKNTVSNVKLGADDTITGRMGHRLLNEPHLRYNYTMYNMHINSKVM